MMGSNPGYFFKLYQLSGRHAYESTLLRKEEVLGLKLHSKNRVFLCHNGVKNCLMFHLNLELFELTMSLST